ncbi:MAG: hypothetical protein ACLUUO_02815 [Sellimonas intestinalis]
MMILNLVFQWDCSVCNLVFVLPALLDAKSIKKQWGMMGIGKSNAKMYVKTDRGYIPGCGRTG